MEKANWEKMVHSMRGLCRMCNKDNVVIFMESTWAGAQYRPTEKFRGSVEDAAEWCYAHRNDCEFNPKYVSQYNWAFAD